MTSATGVLVERDAELRMLERALEEVEGGRSRAVGVVGEPGIGKSRLLDEFGARAAARGHVVLGGRAAELERDVPFAVIYLPPGCVHSIRSVGEDAVDLVYV